MAVSKYGKYLVKTPIREVGKVVKGHQTPTMTYMSNDLVPGSNTYIDISWIWEMPDPNPHIFEHSHDFNEIVLHIGSDPDNPEELGAKIEYVVGGEPLILDKTSAVYIPKGVKHGPLTWKRVEKPHIEITIMLGAGTLKQAAPGGYSGK